MWKYSASFHWLLESLFTLHNRNSWFVVHFAGYSADERLLWFTMWYSIKCFYTFITCSYISYFTNYSVKAHSMRLQFLLKNIAFAEFDGFRYLGKFGYFGQHYTTHLLWWLPQSKHVTMQFHESNIFSHQF